MCLDRTLARPNQGACATCRSRPICRAYLERLERERLVVHGGSRWPLMDTLGRLVCVAELDDGRVRVELECLGTVRFIQGLPKSGRFKEGPRVELGSGGFPLPGHPVAVFNVRPRRPLDAAPEARDLVPSRITDAYELPI
jgi:hypothetical protein